MNRLVADLGCCKVGGDFWQRTNGRATAHGDWSSGVQVRGYYSQNYFAFIDVRRCIFECRNNFFSEFIPQKLDYNLTFIRYEFRKNAFFVNYLE